MKKTIKHQGHKEHGDSESGMNILACEARPEHSRSTCSQEGSNTLASEVCPE